MEDWRKEGPAVRGPAPDLVAPKVAYGCLVVYGPTYLALLKKIWIPNFLQILKTTKPGILKKMNLCIYCRNSELAKVKTCFAPLRKVSNFQVSYLPMVKPPRSSNQYPEMNRMHQDCLKKASYHDAPVFFFFPDQVLSSNCINYAWDLLQKGIRLCQFPSVRVNMRPTLRLLQSGIRRNPGKVFQPRALACLALGNLHRLCTGLFWEHFAQEKFPCSPYALIHPISPKTLLIHGLHNYIFFARPEVILHHARSIDVDFIQDGFPDKRLVYMVEDSDAMMAFDLSENNRRHDCEIPAQNRKRRIQKIISNQNLFKQRHLQTCASPAVIHLEALTLSEKKTIRDKEVALAPFLCKANYKIRKKSAEKNELFNIRFSDSFLHRIDFISPEKVFPEAHPDKPFYLKSKKAGRILRLKLMSTKKLFDKLASGKNRQEQLFYAQLILQKYEDPDSYKKSLVLNHLKEVMGRFIHAWENITLFFTKRFRLTTQNPFYEIYFFMPKVFHRTFLRRFQVRRLQDA